MHGHHFRGQPWGWGWEGAWHSRWHRRPSRLLWFLIGAGTASFYFARKDARENGQLYGGYCRKVPVQAPPMMQANLEQSQKPSHWRIPYPNPPHMQPQTPPSMQQIQRPSEYITQSQVPVDHTSSLIHQVTEKPPHFTWGKGFETFEQQRVQWEQERDRLVKKAQEAMTEMSEVTLDSLSSTIEALRTKLSEHKMEKEKQQKILEQELEEKRNPPRWV
uniref:Uncharacterized protein n=1 Tax=Moniliophthora roreri TaxID=221103 RepID=A0A0W0G5R4_MONRR